MKFTFRTLRGLGILLLVAALPGLAVPQTPTTDRDGFRLALPGYQFEFPRDHGSHDAFRTEWWYYTGHLQTKHGRRLGFEVTFFRVGVRPPGGPVETAWDLRNLALAHFAITDVPSRDFRYYEKLNRASRYTADAREGSLNVFNEGWSVSTQPDGSFRLRASEGDDAIDLVLVSKKPPVIHGENGVSVKAEGVGYASHYVSLTRLVARGLVTSGRKTEECEGLAWMDHEFGSSSLRETQAGWDWFSVQLENGTELMLYQIRTRTGAPDATSSGSFVAADGHVIHLRRDDFVIRPLGRWKSKRSGAIYPMGWSIHVIPLDLDLTLRQVLDDQELVTTKSTRVTYWEGAVSASGTFGDTTVRGDGYVEMTGYDRPFSTPAQ